MIHASPLLAPRPCQCFRFSIDPHCLNCHVELFTSRLEPPQKFDQTPTTAARIFLALASKASSKEKEANRLGGVILTFICRPTCNGSSISFEYCSLDAIVCFRTPCNRHCRVSKARWLLRSKFWKNVVRNILWRGTRA